MCHNNWTCYHYSNITYFPLLTFINIGPRLLVFCVQCVACKERSYMAGLLVFCIKCGKKWVIWQTFWCFVSSCYRFWLSVVLFIMINSKLSWPDLTSSLLGSSSGYSNEGNTVSVFSVNAFIHIQCIQMNTKLYLFLVLIVILYTVYSNEYKTVLIFIVRCYPLAVDKYSLTLWRQRNHRSMPFS